MNTMDASTHAKIVETMRDANQAITGLISVMLQMQANLGVATEALVRLNANVEEKENAAPTNNVTAIADSSVEEEQDEQPSIYQPTQDVSVADEEEKPQQLTNDVLTFGCFAKQILSPTIVVGARGFLRPNVYLDSLFLAGKLPNHKRISKWQTGYYGAGNELMLHTSSFAVVYPGLNESDELDAIEPLVFFKRFDKTTNPQNMVVLHFIEKMDSPTLAILLEEVRNEFSRIEEVTI